ncbi:MAG: hypothetical protein WC067_03965 [Candidatus Methanomethylophilaceae archaeon]
MLLNIIRPDFIQNIERYLGEREAFLLRKGQRSEYLFPNPRGEYGLYSASAQRELIREISLSSGIEFSLKTFRATGTDLFVTADLKNLVAISAQLRHSDYGTTQRYYADIQRGKVSRQLGDTWKKIEIPKMGN